jgi:hypothetical protein
MDNCPICGQFIEVIVRLHAHEPFVDGRCYDMICFTCFTIPKTWEYGRDGEIIWHGTKSPDRLATVEEMMSEGWDKQEAEKSLKAIKRLLRNPRIVIVPENGVNILECLFLGESLLYEL